MDFNFSVNAIFKDKLSKVGSNLLPNNCFPDRRGDGDVVAKVSMVLDKMGIVSGKAQKLPGPITSATKLRNSDHVVYILTDPEGNRGHGSVIGILKVGFKKLFIYDTNGTQWEMMPLCVLDFYVHESKQRSGFGRMLFEFMLQDRSVLPHHLALDQPSENFLSFMCKHYGLDSIIPQIYNFVVYESFFKGRADNSRCTSSANSSSSGSNARPSQKANTPSVQCVKAMGMTGDSMPSYGRHSAKKAGCTMAEYMQDGSSATSNGTRQGSHATNYDSSHPKKSLTFDASRPASSTSLNGTGSQPRPTSLSTTFFTPQQSAGRATGNHQQLESDETDCVNDDVNGTGANSPEEMVGKLDLKFHHTHLCKSYYAKLAHSKHLSPTALESSVGQVFRDDEMNETHDEVYENGEMCATQRARKVSNIPIGDDSEEEDLEPQTVEALHFKQNGNPHIYGSDGIRDVRIKKTNFKNLSPYRKW